MSSFDASGFGGRVEIGRVWRFRTIDIAPFAAIEADGLWQGSFGETPVAGSSAGIDAAALRFDAHGISSVPATLGARAVSRIPLGGGYVIVPAIEFGWVHEFEPVRSLEASFAAAPAAPFETQGVQASRNAADTVIGATFPLTRVFSLFGSFNGRFSNVETAYGGLGGLGAEW